MFPTLGRLGRLFSRIKGQEPKGTRRRSRRAPLKLERLEDRLVPAGVWSAVSGAPAAIDTTLLLSNGSVMAKGAGQTNTWYSLSPDASGSYATGTWKQLASMHDTRLYFGSAVLPDGRVFVAGAEYGTGVNTAEIYDPRTNTWTYTAPPLTSDIGDSTAIVLPGGNVLVAERLDARAEIYNPATNTWSFAANKLGGDRNDEESLALLPEGSLLTFDVWNAPNAQKYIPSLNQWVSAGTTPTSMVGPGSEMGAGLLLPDGRALAIGGNGTLAYYTPGANVTDPGSWSAAPSLPNNLIADDAPAAVLPNGRVLLEGETGAFSAPKSYFEFDPSTNTYTAIAPPNSWDASSPAYIDRMLMLPTGQVLFSDSGSTLKLYTPDSGPKSGWQPVISSVTANANGTFHITGSRLNGMSEGAAYGDDAQMASNYPIVRLADAANHVYYATTSNFGVGVGNGAGTGATDFTLPAGLPTGTYSLFVVGSGIASTPYTFNYGTAVIGNGAGLTGHYYGDINLGNQVLTRTDSQVNFTWPNDTAPVAGLPNDNWSVKWTGQVQAQYSQAYTFSTYSDDGVRLYVNGQLVIDNWTYHGPTTNVSAPIQLVAGQKYSIEMDYFEGTGGATAKLSWASASTATQIIPTSQLYADTTAVIGTGIGLTGHYYSDTTLSNQVAIRTDSQVNFVWPNDTAPVNGLPADNWSVKWTGQIQAQYSEAYTFTTTSDDGVRLYVNGQLVIDNWTYHSPTQNSSAPIQLVAGQKYKIEMDYFEGGGQAVAKLAWSSPSTPQQIVPTSQLYPDFVVGTGTGLTGHYYSDTTMSNQVVQRTDAQVNFVWPNDTAPVAGLPADNWSVKWTGQVQAQYSEAYTFSTVSDDGVRLYVNGQLIINNWTYHSPTTDTSAAVQLVAGQMYSIEMDYFEGGGQAVAQLFWTSPSTPRQAIPMSQLYPSAPASTGTGSAGKKHASAAPGVGFVGGPQMTTHTHSTETASTPLRTTAWGSFDIPASEDADVSAHPGSRHKRCFS